MKQISANNIYLYTYIEREADIYIYILAKKPGFARELMR